MPKLYSSKFASNARLLCLGLLIGVTTACGPDATPTAPTTPTTPGAGAGPSAQLTIVVDSLGSEEAITGLSDVSLDATGSTGSGTLAYRLDFGDGAVATSSAARHVYAAPGSYTATATVTDGTGRTMTASKPGVVRSVAGAWLHAGYSAGSREVLVRRLSVTSQAGTTVRGFVGRPNQPDRAVTGELVPPRTLRLAFDDPAFGSLDGVLPKALAPTTPLELRALGGPANGERLAFRPAEGEPVGPPPDAVLNHRYFSFSAPFAIRGFQPDALRWLGLTGRWPVVLHRVRRRPVQHRPGDGSSHRADGPIRGAADGRRSVRASEYRNQRH